MLVAGLLLETNHKSRKTIQESPSVQNGSLSIRRLREKAASKVQGENGMPHIQTDGETEIYYYDWGTGDPVVLIHGWPLTSASWEYQANYLADNGCRVIAYDRRGFGRSEWSSTGYDYNTLAADLNVLLEELDLRNVTLVGFSMGGGEVARYLANYGSLRVSKAVFISSVTPYLLKTEDNPDGVDESVFEEMSKQLEKDRPAFLKEFAAKFYGRTMINRTVSEPFLEFFQSMAMTASPRATIELVDAWSRTDFRNDVSAISVPTLIVHGTGDATVPIDSSARPAAELIPGATLLEYAGEPHGLNATAAQRLNDDLLLFIKGATINVLVGSPDQASAILAGPEGAPEYT
jgi:non-heme chloroperoxidase